MAIDDVGVRGLIDAHEEMADFRQLVDDDNIAACHPADCCRKAGFAPTAAAFADPSESPPQEKR